MGSMKILIYIKKEDAISGNITEYHTHLPQPGYANYVQVSISQDEFARLEDRVEFISGEEMDKLEEESNGRSKEWYKNQYNRNRSPEDQIK